MLKKVLIANRGEIAWRIARTARALGVATVAVYSDADARASHVRAADEAIRIGPAPAAQSYLSIERVVAAARASGADCLHPGYGFLSENPALAEACAAAGIVFVGPPAAAMRRLGDKAVAKALAESLSIPVVPGYGGAAQDTATLARAARRIGLPVMIKAAAGGGGRGMRLVTAAAHLEDAIEAARREAVAAFGDGRLLVEKALMRPRHVEVQVFADRHGNVVHLFERDCTLQRRHQKIVEEAPAPGLPPALRQALYEDAVRLVAAAGYEGAGTVEFLIAPDGEGAVRHHFIEVNTRLQVEHPVTEAVTGLDLVAWQLRVASGERLPLPQERITLRGHAVEARICAEDPAHDFRPATGRIVGMDFADETCLRVDSGVAPGSVVTPHYDSLIAKAIAHGPDREAALDALAGWLSRSAIFGVATNMGLLHALLVHSEVRAGDIDTGLVARELPGLVPPTGEAAGEAIARGVALLLAGENAPAASPWEADDAFQLCGSRVVRRQVVVDGNEEEVVVRWPGGTLSVEVRGLPHPAAGEISLPALRDPLLERVLVVRGGRQVSVGWPVWNGGPDARGSGGGLRAPITGRLVRVTVNEGDTVAAGDVVAVVEAMKMEHVIHAARAGRLVKVAAVPGQQIEAGALVAEIAPAEEVVT